jgi:hypothetical protein
MTYAVLLASETETERVEYCRMEIVLFVVFPPLGASKSIIATLQHGRRKNGKRQAAERENESLVNNQ